MMKCWKNDPDARPTFTELKNQLKDMETLHKVRIFINMKVSFQVGPTGVPADLGPPRFGPPSADLDPPTKLSENIILNVLVKVDDTLRSSAY